MKKPKLLLLIIDGIQHKNLFKALMFLTKTYLVRKTCSMETILIWTEFTNSANFYIYQLASVTKTSNISVCEVFSPLRNSLLIKGKKTTIKIKINT